MYTDILDYKAPEWVERAVESQILRRDVIPTHRYRLIPEAQDGYPIATPIYRWNNFLPESNGYEIFLKREDMAGCELNGNSARKLEFLLADAKMRKADVVTTLGTYESHHCRSTAIACKMLGFDVELFLIPSEDPRQSCLDSEAIARKSGNIFLNRMVGAKVHRLPPIGLKKGTREMEDGVEKLKLAGKNPYMILADGSDMLSIWGYVECVREMIEHQNLNDRFDDIVVPIASGSSVAGLALGLYLTGCKKIRLHAFSVNSTAESLYQYIDEIFQDISQKKNPYDTISKLPKARDMVNIIDRYKGHGYGLISPEELKFAKKIASKSGVILDPIYTTKAALGLWEELAIDMKEARPERRMFRGKRILFLHTGGIFDWFDSWVQEDFNRMFPCKDMMRHEYEE
jgi:D-cysteine desulfhydrase